MTASKFILWLYFFWMDTSEERRTRGMSDLLLCLLIIMVLLVRSVAKGRSFKRWTFFDSIFFLLLFVAQFLFFRSRSCLEIEISLSFFLSHFVKVLFSLNMSETRLNLLFLMMLLSKLEANCWSIDTAFYFVCNFFIFFKKTYVFFSVVSIFFSFPSLFLMVFVFDLDAPLFSFSSLLSLSYLEICLMLRTTPPQFPPPPLLVEICSLVSGWTMWILEDKDWAYNP